MGIFENVNPHCVEKIVALAETNVIKARADIYDQNGVKLWAKGNPVTAEMQEKLSRRKLKTPLELSLELENSVTTGEVVEDCIKLINDDMALNRLAGNKTALATLSHLRLIHLPGALRLLLSAAHDNNEKAYRHVLYTLAICSGYAAQSGMAAGDVDLLLTSALVHDLGEIYIDPEFLSQRRALSSKEWATVALHPKLSYLVTQEIGKLKEAVGLGVCHHHERMDGSGYPGMLQKGQISSIGAIIAAADGTAAILERAGEGAAYQASLAIRIVPEEFPPDMRTFICTSLRPLADESTQSSASLLQTKWVVEKLARSEALIDEMLTNSSGAILSSLQMAKKVCENIGKAIRATGVDYLIQTISDDANDTIDQGEVSLIVKETGWRMRNLARNIYLRLDAQPQSDQEILSPLIALLESDPSPK